MRLQKFLFFVSFLLIAAIGAVVCCWYYPSILSKDDQGMYVLFLVLHILSAIPAFSLTVVFARLAVLFNRNEFFTKKTENIVKGCAIMMAADTLFFVGLTIAGSLTGILVSLMGNILIILVGALCSVLLFLLLRHINRITAQEEELKGLV